MICRLVFNLTCNCFQSKLFVVRTKIRMFGLEPGMWISKGEYELFESVDQTFP